jgi:hypothetical protein
MEVQATIPPNMTAGQSFIVEAGGSRALVQVPMGTNAGTHFCPACFFCTAFTAKSIFSVPRFLFRRR